IYLPFLEETGYVPKEKYSFGPEIFAHAQRAGRHFKLHERACFQTQVKSARWQEDDKRWLVETDRGDKFRARYLIMSAGPLNKAKLPAMKGLDRFKGHMFHTSRWDYDYTGGDTTGGLTGLADKRVGIVGTGATGIQCVPRVADYAKELFVFQRTPSAVDERRNSPTDAAWAESLTPGWRKRRADNFTAICGGVPQEEDLIGDGWTELFSRLTNPIEGYDPATLTEEDVGALAEIGDFQHMNQIRNRVDAVVGNADLAEKLKPWYRQLCKRPTFNDEFLPAFNRPNVTLVDTSAGKGLEQVTENGVVVDGQEYELDCLIFATGFEVGTAYSRRSELELYGRGGIALTEHWADATKTFHGMYTSKFPNWFQIGHTQTAINPNAITMFEDQMEHIAYVITEARNRGATTVEVTPEAENAWVDRVRAPNPVTEMVKTCTPGYYNNEGKPGQGAGLFEEFFAEGPMVFRQVLSDWRNEGSLEGLRLE
ncbi:MAG: NAD(P)/FAD-dependent oxidoreductase, partial [Pseudomonadota bacterium]